MGWLRGLEPPTSGITIQYSNQLSYSHHGSILTVFGARPAGLEPATAGLEGRCSIRLSYGRLGRDCGTRHPFARIMSEMRGRGDRIRTCDFLLPKQALYQAELHPVQTVATTKPDRVRILRSARNRVKRAAAHSKSAGSGKRPMSGGVSPSLCASRAACVRSATRNLSSTWLT